MNNFVLRHMMDARRDLGAFYYGRAAESRRGREGAPMRIALPLE